MGPCTENLICRRRFDSNRCVYTKEGFLYQNVGWRLANDEIWRIKHIDHMFKLAAVRKWKTEIQSAIAFISLAYRFKHESQLRSQHLPRTWAAWKARFWGVQGARKFKVQRSPMQTLEALRTVANWKRCTVQQVCVKQTDQAKEKSSFVALRIWIDMSWVHAHVSCPCAKCTGTRGPDAGPQTALSLSCGSFTMTTGNKGWNSTQSEREQEHR